jgi:hypothetical protein
MSDFKPGHYPDLGPAHDAIAYVPRPGLEAVMDDDHIRRVMEGWLCSFANLTDDEET